MVSLSLPTLSPKTANLTRKDESLGPDRHLCGFCAAIALLSASPAAAHPHVWVSVRSEIILNADHQITGIRHAWTFDEFYSAMAVQGLDTNGDGVFSAEELKPLAEVNIKSLKDFDYFTFVHVGDADNLPLRPPENYSLDYDKGLLTLHLTLPLDKPIDAHGQEVQVDVYDPSFFVAFGFATEAPVKLSGDATKGCTAEIKKPNPDTGGRCEGVERGVFQSARTEQQFRRPVRPDGDGEMQRRAIITSTGCALLFLLGALMFAVFTAAPRRK